MTDTRWNGEPCKARRITAIVADDDRFPAYWARHLVGTRRSILEVEYAGETFYLDDENASGWHKVTHGGSPHWTHSSITVDPDSIQPRHQDHADHSHTAQTLLDQQSQINDLAAERDGAYRERAHLVALVASGLAEHAVVAPAPDIDEPGWQILYATLHGRQCSWHIAPRDADLFEHLEHVPLDDPRAQWDGHTTEAKYQHIDWLALALGTPGTSRKG